MAALKSLSKIGNHYSRKENLLFPYLEKAGITAPPKVMWGVDDEIRGMYKLLIRTLETNGEVLESELARVEKQVRSMIDKENNILIPMLHGCMDNDAWLTVARDSTEIGCCFNGGGIEEASPSDAATWYRWNASMNGKDDFIPNQEVSGEIKLPSGHFTLEELAWTLNTLLSDITFVGADDKVRFFSEGKERIFPRTRSIIGRDVEHCHPPKSLAVVEKLISDFKAGRKGNGSFWIQKGSQFILIRYYAVRNNNQEYHGVLEVTEEISGLRSLDGQKTLLG
ncbi:MAG: PAS domain-containing protein [Sphaerochaeta sp.]|uniref:PAS domain-containing protein n=1 Tax=Sphaerochaeta sp. TaxID=1972642 RepID=UPI003D0D9275